MVDVDKSGGAISEISGGTFDSDSTLIQAVDPENWTLTFFRALKVYVESNVQSEIYDVRFGFPAQSEIVDFLPLGKTIIHFEVDDVDPQKFGFGQNIVDADEDEASGTTREFEAQCFVVNMDVGIWTSARAGGTTARLVAFQKLHDLFTGPERFVWIREYLGIEILELTGGSFIVEEIGDIAMFRVAGLTLRLRIYARNVRQPVTYIEEAIPLSQIDIDGNVIVG